MKYRFTNKNGQPFYLCPLRQEDAESARLLCDACVGENLYSKEDILRAITEPERFFYLLKTDKGEIAGYIYYYLTDEASIAKSAKIDTAVLYAVYRQTEKKIGKIQAIGLKKSYRGMGLAVEMLRCVLNELAQTPVEAIFNICWKPGGIVPIGKALQECGFHDLAEVKMVWHDDPDLICPYCKGRCKCDAELYYKLI